MFWMLIDLKYGQKCLLIEEFKQKVPELEK